MSSKAPKKSKSRSQPRNRIPNTSIKTVAIPFAKTQIIKTVNPPQRPAKALMHTQLVLSVVGTTQLRVNNGKSIQRFRLNPSNPALFPTIAYEAANYDMYRLKKMTLRYVPIVTVQNSGRVSMVWDADSRDSAPQSRQETSAYSRSVSTAVYEKCSLTIPADNQWRFIADNTAVDRKLIDFGQLLFVTHSGSEGVEIGDVFFECEVEFKGPQPTATVIQKGVADVGGALSSEGPSYLMSSDLVVTPSGFGMNLDVAGTYLLTLVVAATASGNITVAGNSTLVGEARAAYSSGNYIATLVFTSTGVLSATPSIQFTGSSGVTRVQLNLARCKPANTYVTG
uniref:Capsid protein n=1 Tax=Red clover necrotic mosaic virus TaxID=12267 RepID=Q9QMF8_RCNMV|nr:36 kDa coat protein [Red clover necrotic mosaic virus]